MMIAALSNAMSTSLAASWTQVEAWHTPQSRG